MPILFCYDAADICFADIFFLFSLLLSILLMRRAAAMPPRRRLRLRCCLMLPLSLRHAPMMIY